MKEKIKKILNFIYLTILFFVTTIGFATIINKIPFINKYAVEIGLLLATGSFAHILYKLGKEK